MSKHVEFERLLDAYREAAANVETGRVLVTGDNPFTAECATSAFMAAVRAEKAARAALVAYVEKHTIPPGRKDPSFPWEQCPRCKMDLRGTAVHFCDQTPG